MLGRWPFPGVAYAFRTFMWITSPSSYGNAKKAINGKRHSTLLIRRPGALPVQRRTCRRASELLRKLKKLQRSARENVFQNPIWVTGPSCAGDVLMGMNGKRHLRRFWRSIGARSVPSSNDAIPSKIYRSLQSSVVESAFPRSISIKRPNYYGNVPRVTVGSPFQSASKAGPGARCAAR